MENGNLYKITDVRTGIGRDSCDSDRNYILLEGTFFLEKPVRQSYATGFIEENPFGNCQILSVRHFGNILEPIFLSGIDKSGIFNVDRITIEKKDLMPAISKLREVKRGMMVDVYNKYTPIMDKLFDNAIVFKTPYTNMTSSNMCVYYINLFKM